MCKVRIEKEVIYLYTLPKQAIFLLFRFFENNVEEIVPFIKYKVEDF